MTSIGEEHLEGLGDLAGVLREESAVFADVPVAIVPAGQPEIAEAARPLAKSVVVAGLEAGTVRPDRWSITPDGAGTLSFGDVEDPLAERGIMVSYETVRYASGVTAPLAYRAVLRSRRVLGIVTLLACRR